MHTGGVRIIGVYVTLSDMKEAPPQLFGNPGKKNAAQMQQIAWPIGDTAGEVL